LNRGVNQIGLVNTDPCQYRTMMIYEKQKIPAMYRLRYRMNKLKKIII